MNDKNFVHSNAFNFMSFMQNSVDPRTGQYTLGVELPELIGNHLNGPSLPLRLSFNPLSQQDAGFGHGWSLNLTQYVPASNMLDLHTGERYKVTGSDQGDGTGHGIDERKLLTFQLHRDGTNGWRVVHKSGLVEFLQVQGTGENAVALPVRVEAATGHWITLSYGHSYNGVPCLTRIEDGIGLPLLAISYGNGEVYLDLHPGAKGQGKSLARYGLMLHNLGSPALRVVHTVELPYDQDAVSPNKGSWRFEYDLVAQGTERLQALLKTVHNPVGGTEHIEHEYGATLGHRFPGDTHPPLPRVKRHVLDPRAGQPATLTTYAYSSHNFLGRGAAGVSWTDNGLDNLYTFVGSDYEYHTVASHYLSGDEQTPGPVRLETSYYNRFHLLTRRVTVQNGHEHEVVTAYHERPGERFSMQPRYFQMPASVTRRWRLGAGSWPREEVDTTTFDDFGNPLDEALANGTRTRHRYFPAAGQGSDCPPDPHGFVRSLRDQTVIPGVGDKDQPAATILRTQYTYERLQALAGAHDTAGTLLARNETLLALASEESETGQVHRSTAYSYFIASNDPLSHGRIKQQVVTLGGKSTTTTYEYEMSAAIGEHVLQTVQTLRGFDHGEPLEDETVRDTRKVITLRQDTLINQPLLNRDDNDVEIAYAYDDLRRVVEETVAPNDPLLKASRRYTYSLVSLAGQQAQQTSEDVKGVVTRTWVDGLNRAVAVERHDADNPDPLRAPAFRASQSMVYDRLGNLVEETEYDWLDYDPANIDARPMQRADRPVQATAAETGYTTCNLYDDWGQLSCQVTPNGVRHFTQNDPQGDEHWRLGPVQTTWRESADGELRDAGSGELLQPGGLGRTGKTVTRLNLFDNPVRIERFSIDRPGNPSTSYSVQYNAYDGLGRLTSETDARNVTQRSTYDVFDRLVDQTLADKSVVHRDYATHSGEDLPVLIRVGNKVLGEQRFDGLGRMIESTTGGRVRKLSYLPGQSQPHKVITPAGEVIEYRYDPRLSEQPVFRKVINPASSARPQNLETTFSFDPKNARLVDCVEQGQALQRTYFSFGAVKSETRGIEGDEYTMHYHVSLRERELSYTDVLGQTQYYEYNAAGNLHETRLGELSASFHYDTLGRQIKVCTQEGAQYLTTTLAYDEFDRETLRTFDINGTVQTLAQAYDVRDALVSRTLAEGQTTLREETYQYDDRARLEKYTSEGELSPIDPFGKVIREQLFRMDELDNITQVRTTFPEGRNTARYQFDNAADPAQLTGIDNSHADYQSGNVTLIYDGNGNLIEDERQRALSYDPLGRLVEVSVPATPDEPAQSCTYGYDPVDRLASQSS
ncbi:sugar-binding protein [Pseudomonas sp. 22-AL-CL-001]|uniref:RHS repeat domain-containing protein n=1 Tax=Pseudomonas alabamensis TaxID=3064349 RepID=UPI0027140064|nr:sugar-binding protein [Pseudomonas sp. 22-AL-CL-001]MDO7912669.1 sugar-binding protein [Pseudomonas sp. 22-AL-CL-001]